MTSQPLDGVGQEKASLSELLRSKLLKVTGDSSEPNSTFVNGPTGAGTIQNLSALQDKKRKQEIAAWVNQQYAHCKAARSSAENQWYINLAFTNGKHYVTPVSVPGQGFRLQATKSPPWRVRMTINKCRVAVRTEHAKLIQNRPIPTVIPSTGENEDFAAANVGEQLLKARFGTMDFDAVYRSWAWWGVVCGTSFLKQYWDGSAIDYETSNVEDVKGMDGKSTITAQDGSPVRVDRVVKGKIQIERVTPFHIFVPDLTCETLEGQPYVMHVMTRSPLYVRNNFGFVPTCDAKASTTILESAFMTSSNGEAVLDSVLVKEVWIKPNAHKDFPEGGLVTVINDRVVQYVTKWPWPFPEYPFYKFNGINTGGFYGDSTLVDLIPLNKEYNRTKSQMLEIKNTMGKPHLLYQQGSLNPRMISSEPGQAIPYKMGFEKPEVLPGVEVPATMGIELDRLTSEFDDISGQHEITRGNTPPQVTSGTAIAFLQEQDDSKLKDQTSSIEHAIEVLGRHYLKLVSKYWTEPRVVKIVGRDSAFEAKAWKGADLRGNTDTKTQSGSALPFSKAARTAMISEFMANGWIEPASGMEVLEMGSLQRLVDEALIDKKQAQRENLKLLKMDDLELEAFLSPPPNLVDGLNVQGQPAKIDPETQQEWVPESPIPVNSWDDHAQHITFHNMFRKSQEFELLSNIKKQAMEMHVQAHQMAMQSVQEGMMGAVAGPQPDPNADPNAQQQPQGPPPGPDPELEESRRQEEFENKERREEETHQMSLVEREETAEQRAAKAEMERMAKSAQVQNAKKEVKKDA